MRLTSRLKSFYLKSIKIPLIGSTIVDPLLRTLWKLSVSIDNKINACSIGKYSPNKEQLSSYSAAVYTLQKRIEAIEKRQDHLQSQISENYFKGELRNRLSASIFDGVYEALSDANRKTGEKK